MTGLLTKPFTYEDYLQLPDDGNRYEIIEGELFVTPPPTAGHQFSSGRLYLAIATFVLQHQLGEVYHAPFEVHLSDSVRPVQPDITFIRTVNKPKAKTVYFEGIPDLVVEILSPSTYRTDTVVKFSAYESSGVSEYWIVDPILETLHIHVLEEANYRLWGAYKGREVITSKVLMGLEIVNDTLYDRDG